MSSRCAVCAEKDKRLKDLKGTVASLEKQIERLYQMVSPQMAPFSNPLQAEMDSILDSNGANEGPPLTEDEQNTINAEREALLNGTF